MDGSRAVSTKKKTPFRRLQLREGVFFLVSQMTSLITTFIVFIIFAFSQKVKHHAESLQACAVSHCWAQPLRHCFAMPPPLPRGGFGSPRKVNGFARGSPTRGAVERSETERLYEGEPDLFHAKKAAAFLQRPFL